LAKLLLIKNFHSFQN